LSFPQLHKAAAEPFKIARVSSTQKGFYTFKSVVFAILANQAERLRSLKTVPVPQVPGLDEHVRNRGVLVALGKAFFRDMQAGSDGHTACASCHRSSWLLKISKNFRKNEGV